MSKKLLGPMTKAARFGDVYRLRGISARGGVMFIAHGSIERRFYEEPPWIGIRLDRPGQAEDFISLDYRDTWEKVSDAAD